MTRLPSGRNITYKSLYDAAAAVAAAVVAAVVAVVVVLGGVVVGRWFLVVGCLFFVVCRVLCCRRCRCLLLFLAEGQITASSKNAEYHMLSLGCNLTNTSRWSLQRRFYCSRRKGRLQRRFCAPKTQPYIF